MKTEVPWQRIVEHHKEICKRAEEDFFSLPIEKQDSDRWTSIEYFKPEQLHGPWMASDTELTSQAFRRCILHEEIHEMYIGGPCYLRWKKNKNGFSAFWQPVLYRAVKVIYDEAGFFIIKPDQGNWDISPLVYQFLEAKNICLEQPLEELMQKIIEKVHKKVSSIDEDLTDSLIEAIERSIPELGDVFKETFRNNNQIRKPSNWVLFVPAEASALTRNLVSDYNQLEKLLQQDAGSIGGLRLLVTAENVENQEPTMVLPIVPLNTSQQAAVEGILRKKPVTVISGPPGCGKSQVVLSVIMNSWAQGDTVLFASNNNQAVDVVRERLNSFEEIFPISVRAGARNFSNVQDVIKRVINTLSYENKGIRQVGLSDSNKKELLQKKNQLQEYLESKLPQIINQSVNSAINAYGSYQEAQTELDERIEFLVKKLANLGYRMDPELFESSIVNPFQEWVDSIGLVKTHIEQNQIKHKRISTQIDLLIGKREMLFTSIGDGSEDIENWEWLAMKAPLEKQRSWQKQIKTLIEKPLLEEKLNPYYWQSEYDFWENDQQAAKWAVEAEDTAGMIYKMLSKRKQQVIDVLEIKEKMQSAKNDLENIGVMIHEKISGELVKDWFQAYALLSTIPSGSFSWFPFSEKGKCVRDIRKIENVLRRQIPVSVWRDCGTLDDKGRANLCHAMEIIDRTLTIEEQWKGLEPYRINIDEQFSQLRNQLQALQCSSIPANWEINQWEETLRKLSERIIIAKKAIESHKKKQEYNACKESIVSIFRSFQSINIGIPIRECWIQHNGVVWKNLTHKVITDFTASDLASIKKLLYEGTMELFINTWNELNVIQTAINDHKHQLEDIPAESLLSTQWWNQRPQGIAIDVTDQTILPEGKHEINSHLTQCRLWDKTWCSFKEKEYLTYVNKVDTERKRALEMLREAVDKLPHDDNIKSLMAVAQPLLEQKVIEWPISAIAQSVEQYNPERLKAQIQLIDAQIEAMTFDDSKHNRVIELCKDTDIQATLDRLSKRYGRGNGKIDSTGYQDFNDSLKALPVWITTALSAQSIPMIPELFDLLIIDEATQCTLTNLLPLIYRAKRIAVIGDPEQLPAIDTINAGAETALADKLGISEYVHDYGHAENDVYRCFAKVLPRGHADVLMLTEHYRSHPMIIGFANQHVYQKHLILKKDPDYTKTIPFGSGIHGFNVSGQCRRGERNASWCNEPEAEEVVNIINQLKTKDDFSYLTIGVVSPFRAQVELIAQKLEDNGIIQGITVGTVHKFQGDERDIIIFSPVVSRGITDSAARWVENPRNLINVAVTRAREAFFFIGDFMVCRRQPGILGELTRYVDTVADLRKTSLVELDLFSWMIVSGWSPEVHCRIGDIEVDFVLNNNSKAIKLAIEVDGSQHNNTKAQDASRDAFLISKGYKVLRFSARDVKEVPARVIKIIEENYNGLLSD